MTKTGKDWDKFRKEVWRKFRTENRSQCRVKEQAKNREEYRCLKMVLDIRMPEWHQKMK